VLRVESVYEYLNMAKLQAVFFGLERVILVWIEEDVDVGIGSRLAVYIIAHIFISLFYIIII
jgi:hypothetical protein